VAPMSPLRLTLSFTIGSFLCFDVPLKTIWKSAAFQRGHCPIRTITARHSLSPDSFTLRTIALPCGRVSPCGELVGLTVLMLHDQTGGIPPLFRWGCSLHVVAKPLTTATRIYLLVMVCQPLSPFTCNGKCSDSPLD
jgi:hypothetical protein